MRIAFATYGCRLNRAESLNLQAALTAAGHTIAELKGVESGIEPAADLIIVRGCSVTARAQRDCEKHLAKLRLRHPHSEVLATGCLPGAIPAAELLRRLGAAGDSTAVPTATSRAYLKVQDGCSGRCAFCIVPQFRGKPVSEPFAAVLDEARRFLEAGYREIVVTGCNLALYRSEKRGLAALLAALAALPAPAPHRVRLGSLEPGICDAALLDAFAAHPNICPFAHISLQSGSDGVLRRMNRPYTAAAAADFCTELVRRRGPRTALSADVIAGFPGETEAEFAQTLEFVRAAPITNLHVFPYSERPGTAAAAMPGALPRAVRAERAKILEQAAAAKRRAFMQTFVGDIVEVCIERGGDHGRTAEYLPLRLAGQTAPRRSLAAVKVTAAEAEELLGVLA